eukprot:6006184-Alexandrium_andersonii.AAC.1
MDSSPVAHECAVAPPVLSVPQLLDDLARAHRHFLVAVCLLLFATLGVEGLLAARLPRAALDRLPPVLAALHADLADLGLGHHVDARCFHVAH